MPNPAPDANRPGWPALKAPPLPRANRQIQRAEPGPAQGQQAAWGYRALLRSADAENLGATGRTEALGGRLAVLHGDTLGILDFLFGPALDAIGFHQSITSLLRVDILYSPRVAMSICGMLIFREGGPRHKLSPLAKLRGGLRWTSCPTLLEYGRRCETWVPARSLELPSGDKSRATRA